MCWFAKASSIGKRELLTNWLYGVAYRTAARARVEAAKRRARESAVIPKQAPDLLAEISARELLAVLDEELSELPALYRGPLVVCYLEGKTRDEAAHQFGWSLATLARRLERGREILRTRLDRRGLGLPMTLFSVILVGGTRQTLKGHKGQVNALAFSKDGRWIATSGATANEKAWEVILWDAKTGEAKQAFPKLTEPVHVVAFSPDGKTLAVCGGGGWGDGENTKMSGEITLIRLE